MRISDWSSDVCSSDLNFKSLAIDQDGFVSVTFDNGNVKKFYQIPMVKFRDPTELDRVNGNAFVETPGSGAAVLVQSGSRDRKSVVSGKSVSVRVDLGGRRISKKKNKYKK